MFWHALDVMGFVLIGLVFWAGLLLWLIEKGTR